MSYNIFFPKNRSYFNIFGLYVFLIFFVFNAFHYKMKDVFQYYREFFCFIFLFLTLYVLLDKKSNFYKQGIFNLNKNLFFLLFFPFLLIFWSFFDTKIPLYGELEIDNISESLSNINVTIYTLRNAFIFLPMVLYAFGRGLNRNEIKLICLIVTLVSPLSINSYLKSGKLESLDLNLLKVAELGGMYIDYNTFVPYLTFSVICGVYLLFNLSGLLRIVIFFCIAYVIIFCIFSTSRQSVMFIVIIFFSFFAFRLPKLKLIFIITFFLFFINIISFVQVNFFNISENTTNRFGSFEGFFSDKTSNRGNAAIDGLLMLEPMQYLIGAGLTSVLNSGPHNDYVRWVQRVGIFLMIFGFIPFFLIFIRAVSLVLHNHYDTFFKFLALVVGFTIFHSFFCYPREEANQSVAVYLGLSLWFGSLSEGLIPARDKKHHNFKIF
jgi:hypothetical protein